MAGKKQVVGYLTKCTCGKSLFFGRYNLFQDCSCTRHWLLYGLGKNKELKEVLTNAEPVETLTRNMAPDLFK